MSCSSCRTSGWCAMWKSCSASAPRSSDAPPRIRHGGHVSRSACAGHPDHGVRAGHGAADGGVLVPGRWCLARLSTGHGVHADRGGPALVGAAQLHPRVAAAPRCHAGHAGVGAAAAVCGTAADAGLAAGWTPDFVHACLFRGRFGAYHHGLHRAQRAGYATGVGERLAHLPAMGGRHGHPDSGCGGAAPAGGRRQPAFQGRGGRAGQGCQAHPAHDRYGQGPVGGVCLLFHSLRAGLLAGGHAAARCGHAHVHHGQPGGAVVLRCQFWPLPVARARSRGAGLHVGCQLQLRPVFRGAAQGALGWFLARPGIARHPRGAGGGRVVCLVAAVGQGRVCAARCPAPWHVQCGVDCHHHGLRHRGLHRLAGVRARVHAAAVGRGHQRGLDRVRHQDGARADSGQAGAPRNDAPGASPGCAARAAGRVGGRQPGDLFRAGLHAGVRRHRHRAEHGAAADRSGPGDGVFSRAGQRQLHGPRAGPCRAGLQLRGADRFPDLGVHAGHAAGAAGVSQCHCLADDGVLATLKSPGRGRASPYNCPDPSFKAAMVPHLITALTGPINELEQRIIDSMPATERWFRLEWMEHTPPFYTSVDIRNAGFKLAPVDTNLFPGGWNNLTPEMLPLAVQAAMAAIEKICPEARNLLIIPENHTRNVHYLSNLVQLQRIFNMAGLNVRIGSIDPAIKTSTVMTLPDGESIALEPVIRGKRRLGGKDFDPCTILLNTDLSAGVPGILEEIYEQYVLPPLHAGWTTRRKSTHFKCYEEVAKRMGKLLGIDPWLIHPLFDRCENVHLGQNSGFDALQTQVDSVLTRVKRKYKEYGIKEKPFVVVKADNGTYGMGIMTVHDAKELQALNRKTKNKMAVAKDGQPVHDVIIQEGVLTQERMSNAVAEPVVYMMDRYVVGGFYRIHADRGVDENLNAPGADFVPLAFEHGHHLPQLGARPGASAPNRFYMYGVIARLAMLAASYELEATNPDAEIYD